MRREELEHPRPVIRTSYMFTSLAKSVSARNFARTSASVLSSLLAYRRDDANPLGVGGVTACRELQRRYWVDWQQQS